jgi:hypothetical protein
MITQCSKVASTMWRSKKDDNSRSIVDTFVVIATYVCVDDYLLDHNAAETLRHPDNRSCLVLLSPKAQVLRRFSPAPLIPVVEAPKTALELYPLQKYSDAWLSLRQEVSEPKVAIGSAPRLGGVQWVVQRVKAMEGNDIYHSHVVLCVYWVDLSEEAFRVRHVSDVAERFVSTSLVKK